MSIPALVLEWLELKIAAEAKEWAAVISSSGVGPASDEILHRMNAYRDVLGKLQELKGLDS